MMKNCLIGFSLVLKLFGSFKLKSRLLVIYVVCFAMSVYFYFRHNGYCEPGGKAVSLFST